MKVSKAIKLGEFNYLSHEVDMATGVEVIRIRKHGWRRSYVLKGKNLLMPDMEIEEDEEVKEK